MIDSLDRIEAMVPGLKGKMDKSTIGVGGHSFGAHTAQLVAGTTTVEPGRTRTSHADPRPKAFVLISPQGRGMLLDNHSWDQLTRPVLTVTGSKDWGRNGDPPDWRLDPYRLAASKQNYLLYIEGAQHGFGGIASHVPYNNAGPTDPDQLACVQSITTAFWNLYLKENHTAIKQLESGPVVGFGQTQGRIERR